MKQADKLIERYIIFLEGLPNLQMFRQIDDWRREPVESRNVIHKFSTSANCPWLKKPLKLCEDNKTCHTRSFE